MTKDDGTKTLTGAFSLKDCTVDIDHNRHKDSPCNFIILLTLATSEKRVVGFDSEEQMKAWIDCVEVINGVAAVRNAENEKKEREQNQKAELLEVAISGLLQFEGGEVFVGDWEWVVKEETDEKYQICFVAECMLGKYKGLQYFFFLLPFFCNFFPEFIFF